MRILDVVILAGGKGTRLSEETTIKPKPMVMIGNKPILWHIIKIYQKYGCKNFYIATGYKSNHIKNYFKKNKIKGISLNVVYTGIETQTGGRIYKLKKYLNNKKFLMSYGDGLSNVNIKKLIDFHEKKRADISMTAVRPPARWGVIKITNGTVIKFEEKNEKNEDWINGGFFVVEPNLFKKFKFKSNTIFEVDILPKMIKGSKLSAYKHDGFWQCMDTLRDKKTLNRLYRQGAPWIK